jgi:hypothetical protein
MLGLVNRTCNDLTGVLVGHSALTYRSGFVFVDKVYTTEFIHLQLYYAFCLLLWKNFPSLRLSQELESE